MTALPVTSFFAGLAALGVALLGFNVAFYRYRAKVSYGDQGDKALLARVRAHGNYIEYVPIALIALGLIELSGSSTWMVWALGGSFAVARFAHAAGLLRRALPVRVFGATLTFLTLAAMGLVLLARAL